MNEEQVLKEVDAFVFFSTNLLEVEKVLKTLPIFSTTAELDEKANTKTQEVFQTPASVLDEFLKQKFDTIGIGEFMKIYTEKHFGQPFCLPVVTENVSCFFGVSDDPNKLSTKLLDYQSLIGHGGTFLNLHTDEIYKFTLIRAAFPLSQMTDLFFAGYHHETKHFHFFIRSSAQADLTIVYEELENNKGA